MKGSYILIIELKNNKKIQVGKLGDIFFKKGFYVYVGSALNGLEQRINRHLRKTKKKHWHIDYLLEDNKIIKIYYKESNEKKECIIANNFKKLEKIVDFGCSDCKCISHLFYGNQKEINSIILKLNFSKYF